MKQLLNIHQLVLKTYRLVLLTFIIGAVSSCDSILNYDEGDCTVEYMVKFKYDYNMKFANAFSKEVKTVTLYAFDENGQFIYQKTEEGARLEQDDYAMKVEIEPGKYRLIAWAGLKNNDDSFAVPLLIPGKSDLEELTVKTLRSVQTRATNGDMINLANPNLASLWFGESLQTFTRAGRQDVVTVPLIKNTNTFRILLQQMQGVEIDVNQFEFSIKDDNGWMNYDNSLLKDDILTYQPYYRASGGITRTTNNIKAINEEETTPISTAIAEIKVGRLVLEKNPRLTITNKKTKEIVLSLPLIDYLVMTKPTEYNISSQEYLDRQDMYNMTFFLDPNMAWLQTEIIINGWTIRLNDTDL